MAFLLNVEISWGHTSKENKEIPILQGKFLKIHIFYVLDVGLQVLLLQFENDYSRMCSFDVRIN